jgi:diguanylate cyclase (GGDEF)-like protein
MNPTFAILICDHRGEGLSSKAIALERSGYSIVVSTSLRQSLEHMAQSQPALIVVDPLSGAGGAELEALERARVVQPESALLLCFGEHDTLPLGGVRANLHAPWDLLRRDASQDELLLRVELLRRQIEQQHEIARLRHVATHDDRTELLRPQVFQDHLKAHFSAAQRHRLDLALVLVDLDAFGRVNKEFDHTVGDRVIARVGNAIRSTLRTEDVAGRLGGDEFALLLPYTRRYDAARVVQRTLEQIHDLSGEVVSSTGAKVAVSASMGFETFNGSDLESVELLRLHAEEALRTAKRQGGNRGVYYRHMGASASLGDLLSGGD